MQLSENFLLEAVTDWITLGASLHWGISARTKLFFLLPKLRSSCSFCFTTHTVTKSQFLSKKSMLMEHLIWILTLNCSRIYGKKLRFAAVCLPILPQMKEKVRESLSISSSNNSVTSSLGKSVLWWRLEKFQLQVSLPLPLSTAIQFSCLARFLLRRRGLRGCLLLQQSKLNWRLWCCTTKLPISSLFLRCSLCRRILTAVEWFNAFWSFAFPNKRLPFWKSYMPILNNCSRTSTETTLFSMSSNEEYR